MPASTSGDLGSLSLQKVFVSWAGVFFLRLINYEFVRRYRLQFVSENEVFLCARKDAEAPRKRFFAEGLRKLMFSATRKMRLEMDASCM